MDILSLIIQAMLSILIFLFSSSLGVLSDEYSSFSKIALPPQVTNPVAVAFDLVGGLYIGVAEGRILRRQSPNTGFTDFVYTSPIRTKQLYDGTTDPDEGPICGKPFSFSINYVTGELYIVDVYFRFLVIGPKGGLATQLATAAEGVTFRFPDVVEVDQLTGMVYFLDSGEIYELRNASDPKFATVSTGRLLAYVLRTRRVTVLLRGLARPTGTAVSIVSTFVLFSACSGRRIQKLWLTGPKAYTPEIFLNLPENPFKIKRTASGDFWVAASVGRPKLPLVIMPIGQKFDAFAKVLVQMNLSVQYPNKTVRAIVEQGGTLYTVSV